MLKEMLRVGQKVKIRQWEDMEKEFGLDGGNIPTPGAAFVESMRGMCGQEFITSADFVEIGYARMVELVEDVFEAGDYVVWFNLSEPDELCVKLLTWVENKKLIGYSSCYLSKGAPLPNTKAEIDRMLKISPTSKKDYILCTNYAYDAKKTSIQRIVFDTAGNVIYPEITPAANVSRETEEPAPKLQKGDYAVFATKYHEGKYFMGVVDRVEDDRCYYFAVGEDDVALFTREQFPKTISEFSALKAHKDSAMWMAIESAEKLDLIDDTTVEAAVDEFVKMCDEPAPKFKKGDRVRVIVPKGSKPCYGWGMVSTGDEGVITCIEGDNAYVNFPEQEDWEAKMNELELISEDSEVTFTSLPYGVTVKQVTIIDVSKFKAKDFVKVSRAFGDTLLAQVIYADEDKLHIAYYDFIVGEPTWTAISAEDILEGEVEIKPVKVVEA